MAKVFELLGTVPAPLLFMKGPKIKHFPFQWAPSTLLGRKDEISTQNTLDKTGRFYVTDYTDYPEMEAQVTPRGLLVKRPGFLVSCLGFEFRKTTEIRVMTMDKVKLPGVDNAGPKPTSDAERMYKINLGDPKTQKSLQRGLQEFAVILQDPRSNSTERGTSSMTWNGIALIRLSYADGMPFNRLHPRAFGGDGRSLGPKEPLYGNYGGFVQVKAGWSTDADHADLELMGVKIPLGMPEAMSMMGFESGQEWYVG